VVSGSYAVAAVVAAATTTVRNTAVVAAAALVLSLISGLWNDNFATLDWGIRVALTLGLGALAVLAARIRVHREHDLRHTTLIAETAQRAVLRAIPSAAGSVGFAARYVSATRQALVGGDLTKWPTARTASVSSSATYAARDWTESSWPERSSARSAARPSPHRRSPRSPPNWTAS
jgi:hypothetical protein